MHAQANIQFDEPSPRPLFGPYGVPKKRNKTPSARCVETRAEERSHTRAGRLPNGLPATKPPARSRYPFTTRGLH